MASVSPPSRARRQRAPACRVRPAPRSLATHLRAALEAAATWLELQAASVNALNVFPVPDGDTGTNMSMTMRAAAEAAGRRAVRRGPCRRPGRRPRRADGRARQLRRHPLPVVRGFAEAVAGQRTLGVQQLADGLERAARAGYRAVGQPGRGHHPDRRPPGRRGGARRRRRWPGPARFWERVAARCRARRHRDHRASSRCCGRRAWWMLAARATA